MTSTSVFADAWRGYVDAGWSGVLPLPPARKEYPPSGYTGEHGQWPTRQRLERWATEQPDGNIALRMPRDVIGIDIDAYKDPQVRARLEEVTGPLPPTWCTTSRVDGSGIRLYRVPVPPSGTVWVNSPVPGVEIIQHHHRYAVVAPSLHPEGRPYRWVDEASGEIGDEPPEIDDLTELPWQAIQALTVQREPERKRDATAFQLTTGPMSAVVERRLKQAIANAAGEQGSRHDAACRDVLALLRYAERGEPGVEMALEALRSSFVSYVGPDRAPGKAEREFDDIVEGGRRRVESTEGRIPTKAERDADASGEWFKVIGPTPTPPADELEPDEIGTGWEPVDIVALWQGGYEPPKPTVCLRSDGEALFYRGRVNALNGESGGGKSWVALAACAEQLAAGRQAIYIDLEDHPGSIIARLKALGVTAEQATRFTYIQPLLPFNANARELVVELMADGDVTIVVVDSVGESMALEQAQQNDDDHVARWFRHIPRALARIEASDGEGPAVVLVDHVPKQNEETKLFAIGSQRKRAAIDGVAYRVDTVVPFSAEKAGKISLTCAKDRNGTYARNQVVAEVNVDPGDRTLVSIQTPAGRDSTGKLTRPTALMERISAFLDEQEEDVSRAQVLRMVSGNDKAKAVALDALIAEGYVTSQPGVFGPKRRPGIGCRSVRRFLDDGGLLEAPKRDIAVMTPYRGQDAAMAASSAQNGYRGHAAPLHTSRGRMAAISEGDHRFDLETVGRDIETPVTRSPDEVAASAPPEFEGLV